MEIADEDDDDKDEAEAEEDDGDAVRVGQHLTDDRILISAFQSLPELSSEL